MNEQGYEFYVGIDWATEAHQVCVVDRERRLRGERSVEHTGAALGELADWLTAVAAGHPERIAIAIEVPRGAVVDTLLERGFHLFALNPKQLDRFRDRHTVAGAKDDRRDAFVLADSLRTDQPAFRRLQGDHPLIVQLRELSRIEEDLQQELNRLTNRLREQLHRFFPQVLRLCPAADEPWLWALVALVPTPAAVSRLPRRHVERLLREHRIRRVTGEAVLAQLQTPALYVAPGTVEAASAHIALLLPRLRLVHEQRTNCGPRIEALLAQLGTAAESEGQSIEHRDVEILRSLPGVGRVTAATMLAEAARPLAQRDYHALRVQTGIAPVTRQSGKRAVVAMRYACHGRLRNAVYHWARVSVQSDPHSRSHYAALRQRGHSHGRALRGVADRLLCVLMVMLKTQTTYDPDRRRPLHTGTLCSVGKVLATAA